MATPRLPAPLRYPRAVPERFERIILGACVAASVGFAALYLGFSLRRITYPFELEWMEGGSLEHLMRVLRGERLYLRPSLEFAGPFVNGVSTPSRRRWPVRGLASGSATGSA